ncbi:hypothetical protein B0H13DRAFT_2540850 [Mycena leptocephala]|nr:hypothetical protein B0H13DRAFT_2540850 [Mycena leptocephala]
MNGPPSVSNLPSALRYLLERDVLVAVEALDFLVGAVSRSGDELDHAILGIWQGFCRDSAPWRNVGERWISCMTSGSSDRQVLSVYLNLLDGSLLVNGKAQGTLPKKIIQHPFFKTLFPNRDTLDIVPSTMKGMDYQSRDNMDEFEVHFKLNNHDLLIRIRHGNFESEFVSPKKLKGDIPNSLVVGMVHLFREQDQFLDIYPAPSGWQPLARAVWRLNLSSQLHRTLSKNTSDIMDSEFVLDPKSSVVLQLSDIFRPLEACETNLLVSFSPPSKRLLVKLPRYNLEFSAVLGGASLESKELPGYFVASVQSIGTLIGLQNKLVLKSMNDEVTKIFVPEGEIAVSGGPEHPRVTSATNILDLVPIREYYPTHLTSMETVNGIGHTRSGPVWSIRAVVNDIVDYAKKQALFHASNHQTITAAYKGEICLWERADFRDSRLVSNVQIRGGCDILVTPMRCLDCPESTTKEHNVAQVAPPAEVWFRLFHLCKASLLRDRDQYGLMVALGILGTGRTWTPTSFESFSLSHKYIDNSPQLAVLPTRFL